jgi:bifunctional non-homologous end joining protein LigD
MFRQHPPCFVEPCLPTNTRAVPTGPLWAYEIKHDGYRFICRRGGGRVRVVSRRGNDHTDRVPLIAEALAALRVESVTLDGEGVVCGPDGVTDFNRLRAALGRKGSRQAFLYVFDLLELDGEDVRADQARRGGSGRRALSGGAGGRQLHLERNGSARS